MLRKTWQPASEKRMPILLWLSEQLGPRQRKAKHLSLAAMAMATCSKARLRSLCGAREWGPDRVSSPPMALPAAPPTATAGRRPPKARSYVDSASIEERERTSSSSSSLSWQREEKLFGCMKGACQTECQSECGPLPSLDRNLSTAVHDEDGTTTGSART